MKVDVETVERYVGLDCLGNEIVERRVEWSGELGDADVKYLRMRGLVKLVKEYARQRVSVPEFPAVVRWELRRPGVAGKTAVVDMTKTVPLLEW